MPRLLKPAASQSVAGKRVLGIDPSLSSTGWAYRDEHGNVVTGHIATKKLLGPWRLHYALTEMEKVIDLCQPELVVYEDYAMGKGDMGRAFHIGELGGVFKRMLWDRGLDVLMVTPTTLKKVITGKGNAGWTPKGEKKLTDKQKKQIVIDALAQDFDVHTPQNDEADAAGLMLVGEIRCGVYGDTKNPLLLRRIAAVTPCELQTGRGSKLQLIAKMK